MMPKLFNPSHRSERFEGQEPDESIALLLRRHRFVILYPVGFILLLALLPLLVRLSLPSASTAFYFLVSLYYLFLWLLLFYKLTLFCLNTVIVTDRRIVENEQNGLFKRKVSELHIHRVQDVSVHVEGIVQTFFNFGDIVVQTAASEREFVFHSIASPEAVKDRIMRAVHNSAPQNAPDARMN